MMIAKIILVLVVIIALVYVIKIYKNKKEDDKEEFKTYDQVTPSDFDPTKIPETESKNFTRTRQNQKGRKINQLPRMEGEVFDKVAEHHDTELFVQSDFAPFNKDKEEILNDANNSDPYYQAGNATKKIGMMDPRGYPKEWLESIAEHDGYNPLSGKVEGVMGKDLMQLVMTNAGGIAS